jgi:hypothetical protein
MQLPECISKAESSGSAVNLASATGRALTAAEVTLEEAQVIQQAVGAETAKISTEQFRQGLEVELEHGVTFPDANVTNNHPLLTGKIVLAHLKEMLDYYERLNVAEVEGDLFKAVAAGNADKVARLYRKLIAARAALHAQEQARLEKVLA